MRYATKTHHFLLSDFNIRVVVVAFATSLIMTSTLAAFPEEAAEMAEKFRFEFEGEPHTNVHVTPALADTWVHLHDHKPPEVISPIWSQETATALPIGDQRRPLADWPSNNQLKYGKTAGGVVILTGTGVAGGVFICGYTMKKKT